MSAIVQPFLPPLAADLFMSLVTIGYGMVWECHYTAWISVVLNVILTVLFLGSNALPLTVLIVLLVYVCLGVVVAKLGVRKLYSFFGTKTFGSLTLTGALFYLGFLNWVASLSNPAYDIAVVYMASWIIIAIAVHILGYHYFGDDDSTSGSRKRR